jgi:hypothetical protein
MSRKTVNCNSASLSVCETDDFWNKLCVIAGTSLDKIYSISNSTIYFTFKEQQITYSNTLATNNLSRK